MLLSDLPVEIILINSEWDVWADDWTDLASLAVCSRLFWNVATPLLYSEIRFGHYVWEYDRKVRNLDWPGKATRVS